MNDLKMILSVLYDCMLKDFIVFGFRLNLFSVFVGFTLIGIVIYSIRRLYS